VDVNPQDLFSALVGDPAARVKLLDAAAGSQDLLGEYATKVGGDLGPLAPLLSKVTSAAQAKSAANTQAAVKSAATGNLGALAAAYALPAAVVAGGVAFLLFLMGRASK